MKNLWFSCERVEMKNEMNESEKLYPTIFLKTIVLKIFEKYKENVKTEM